MAGVRWKVELLGKQEDLLALSHCFTGTVCGITVEEQKFYLVGTHLNLQPEWFTDAFHDDTHDERPSSAANAVKGVADELMAVINGAAFLEFRSFEEVRVGPIIGLGADGRGLITLHHSHGSSTKLWPLDGSTTSPNPMAWFDCSEEDSAVAEALGIFGHQPSSSTERRRDLYNILEIIREDVGGSQKLEARSWVSSNELSDCWGTLNMARHARLTHHPPTPLRPGITEDIVRRVLRAWVGEKQAATH